MHVYMSITDRSYWINELNEACVIQLLYSLFQKMLQVRGRLVETLIFSIKMGLFLQHFENSSIIFSIMEIFYAFSQFEPEILSNSGFTSNTCLIVGKLFEYAFHSETHGEPQLPHKPRHRTVLVRSENSKTWGDTLRLYINIQTLLLNKLKYNFLSDSILFIGSYYELMVQVIPLSTNFQPIPTNQKINCSLKIIQQLWHSCDYDLLKTITTICRYISEISKYKKELLIQVSQTFENIPVRMASISAYGDFSF